MHDIFSDKIADDDLELKFQKKRKTKILDSFVLEYIFEMYETKTNNKVGTIKLRPKLTSGLEEYGGHIEYEVYRKFRKNNYAAKSCIALFPLIKKLNINPVVITCDPSNIPSIKTIGKIGGELISTKNIEISPGEKRLTNKYFIAL